MTTRQAIFIMSVNAVISLIISVIVFLVLGRSIGPEGSGPSSLPPATMAIGLSTALPARTPEPVPQPTVYIVQPGDSLSGIAFRFDVPIEDIMRANGLSNPDLLSVGQELIIPLGGLPPATPTQPITPTPTETPLPFEPPTPLPSETPLSIPAVTATPKPSATSTPTLLATTSMPEEPLVRIRDIIFPGDYPDEAVIISNAGKPVNLEGWTLSDREGNIYVFPDLLLWSHEASVRIHTAKGEDTATELYWNRERAIWGEDDVAILKDDVGNVVDTYQR